MIGTLLGLAIVFLIIAFLAYVVGAKGVAGFSMDIAGVLIFLFVVLFVLSLIFSFTLRI